MRDNNMNIERNEKKNVDTLGGTFCDYYYLAPHPVIDMRATSPYQILIIIIVYPYLILRHSGVVDITVYI